MHLRGIGYAFVASLMFGLGAVLAQLLGKEIDATVAAILALVGGGILLACILVFSGSPLLKVVRFFKWRQWLDLFLLSCPGTALPLLLIVAGFARTSALEGGFLLQVNGVAALIFAVILLKERIRIRQGIGILLLLLGGVLVVFKGTQGIDWSSGGLGDVLLLVGAIGLGFGFVPAKRLTLHIEPLPLTALRLLLGACTLVPILIIQLLVGRHVPQWQPSLTTLWVVLPVYILTNFCLGYLVQQAGLVLLKAWEMAAVMQTVPLFSTIFALLLLHASMTLLQAVGGSLAILGGIIVSLNKAMQVTDSHLKP
ncbi:MAG TPA: DMT family transporter [Ktedonobacteraceae bacterium]|nr:DMT family transporter [Ktedonobacteraceae bacterium]